MIGKTTACWFDTNDVRSLPHCSLVPNSHGAQVLVWPHVKSGDGYADSPTAFYGCRQTDKPLFYLYGAIIHPQPTHWAPLPDGPK